MKKQSEGFEEWIDRNYPQEAELESLPVEEPKAERKERESDAKPAAHQRYWIAPYPDAVETCVKMFYRFRIWRAPVPDDEIVDRIKEYEDSEELSVCRGRDGQNYIWFMDADHQAIANYNTGWISPHPGRDIYRLFL